jgi:uncharacterized caspase-like protein
MQNGKASFWLRSPLPTDGKPIDFAAYAFNSDRVKSDTAHFNWQPPRMTPRARRAFVLTIGVDAYDEVRPELNFAVADARLIAERLARIPGYEVRRASLTTGGPATGNAGNRKVTAEHVKLALSLLTSIEYEGVDARRILTAAGHDVAALDEATPDDIVIISFSGHGFADKTGRFALLPSDTIWKPNDPAPDFDSAVTADELTGWLRYVNAGDIAFIIDACHSGASVDTPDFKPGPMGDSGLGQLAFDKGLRILAATQADDVAVESQTLKQGLLTATLDEGLEAGAAGYPADLDRDGLVRLDEWLRYAVARLPGFAEQVARKGGPMAARGLQLVLRTPAAKPRRVQEPSLFDFNQSGSPAVLRRK